MTRIAIIQGHPDPKGGHFGNALAAAYQASALEAGHEVRTIEVAKLGFPLVQSKDEWEKGVAPETIRAAQSTLAWADHVAIFYPLWLGAMPAILKGFLEQVLRPGFAFPAAGPGAPGKKPLSGKSARIVVTMGMPAFFYRWFFRAHSLRNLERNILGFCGFKPVAHSLIGLVEGKPAQRDIWLRKVGSLGALAR